MTRILQVMTIAVALLSQGCGPGAPGDENQGPGGDDALLRNIRKQGELVVLTRNAPTTYYVDREGLAGPEYDMTTAFAASLGVRVRYEVLDSIAEILAALEAGKGDIAAAGLTETKARKSRFLSGPSYQEVRQQVVCRRGGKRPRDVEAMVGIRLAVVAHSSYIDRLNRLKQRYPALQWATVDDADTEELLEQVWRRKIDCTVADSNIVKINRRYHPELVVAFDLTQAQPLVWYLPPDAAGLRQAVGQWFSRYRKDGELAAMLDRYYGFVQIIDNVDTRSYVRRIRRRLPRYRGMFEQAASRNGLPWTLLAAQSYQESHWDPHARSPTGVRGLMMLTRNTARQLGVDNRLHPAASIAGGAKYLSSLRGRLADEIREPDRTWFALAAYNIGLGHLRDARGLARRLGKDPNRWSDLKTVLPLLSKRRYYKGLRYGYARGNEPVRYVSRIRNFEDLLSRKLRQPETR